MQFSNYIQNVDPTRFQSVFESLNASEQQIISTILQEYADTGTSKTYTDIWLEDYEEIPVDIDTFLEDDEYLS